MMESLPELAKIAGIAGVAVGGLFIIFRSIIHENFLTKMSDTQSYNLTRSIIWISAVIAVLGLGSWVYMKTAGRVDDVKLTIKGRVTDGRGGTVQDLNATLKLGSETKSNSTDMEGKFVLEFHGQGSTSGTISIDGKGYLTSTKHIDVDFNAGNLDVGEIVIRPSEAQRDPIVNAATKAVDSSGIPMNQQMNYSTSASSIVISSSDYSALLGSLGASASVNLIIGGQSYTLTGMNLSIPYTSAGMIDYEISGYTNWGGTVYCNNYTVGQIELAPGAKYYLYENITGPTQGNCGWYLYNEFQFLQQKATLEQQMIQSFE
jgi:hypothetical protein